VVGREHDPVGGADDVKAPVGVRQRLRVTDFERDLEVLLDRETLGCLDQLRCEIQS
jgi:hypothetical protein